MDVEKELFKIFQNKKDDFQLYKDLLKFLDEVKFNIEGIENARFYNILEKLSNSINNAGHENKRSADISFISSERSKISDSYEEFLP